MEKTYRQGITMMQLSDIFPHEASAREWFESRVWLDSWCYPKYESGHTHQVILINCLCTWLRLDQHVDRKPSKWTGRIQLLAANSRNRSYVHKRFIQIYSNGGWKNPYTQNIDIIANIFSKRSSDTEELTDIYKKNLKSLFGERYLDKSRQLKNSKNLEPLAKFLSPGPGEAGSVG